MVVAEAKKNIYQLLANVQAQISHNVDFIPVAQWGFDDAAMEVLKKQKHAAVNKQLSKAQKKKLDNAKKQKIAQSIGVVPQTISEIFNVLARSKLANRKPSRPNVRHIKKTDSDETKENGAELDPKIAEILKKKGVGKRPFVQNAVDDNKKPVDEDTSENGVPFKKARKQHMPLTEEDKEKRREHRKLNRKKKANAAKEARNAEMKAAAEVKQPKEDAEADESTDNKDGLSFSKLDFVIKKDKPVTKKEKREKLSGRDYASLQKKVQNRAEYVEKLREKNPEKAQGLEEKFKWDAAMKRAEGKKVKDNASLLEKAVKAKSKQKEKRKQKWEDRKQKVNEEKEKKQEKREANIAKRREVKVQKKQERARKKGRVVAK